MSVTPRAWRVWRGKVVVDVKVARKEEGWAMVGSWKEEKVMVVNNCGEGG